jgi:hypothetical protein
MNDMNELYQDQNIASFEALVADLIKTGASDRKVAIAWLQESDQYYNDLNFMEFEFGLPWNYLLENWILKAQ